MNLHEALLSSWDRQARIVNAIAALVDETNRKSKPSEDGWPLDHQLAHTHQVRRYWLSQVAPGRAAELPRSFNDNREPLEDLDAIKSALRTSAAAVRAAMEDALSGEGDPVGGYDHPVLFLQHMIWHEGWHVGLMVLALRLAGQEPSEEWEEANVWGEWRTEELG